MPQKTNKGFIVIIAGPTGVGESTVTQALIKRYKNSTRLVTTTSRPKRLNEKNHVDYHFLSKAEFEKQIKEGNFLEWTFIKKREVYYGTKLSDYTRLLNQDKIIFFNCDAKGLKAVKKHFPDRNTSIFINYKNLSDNRKRLTHRDPNIGQEELNKRMAYAEYEVLHEKKYYDHVIINYQGKLQETVIKAYKIIDKALKQANS
ncbi:hypothetical protein COT97_02355 [Candidatus Falkowbacteria bacterium CG10_big_fil_rev_8_21_14_0_10_39_11]|uniref:Guanylate kinase-like domain-containing protein n=1 Tax=Candidatus Falkowbacteria bacterium CG10_big_fil_rev_8_21_14_0_10_39_11 TaxID=1974565 RepID=A0A2H0V5G3_9BACT|nr:MAG: hypothetical protein COT97_02355 [Candidatus Falkowbacteria bacterium CG10_big_fil_rev_8_21_14_0_10_39_11]